jgi:RNA polymerase sigma-70 factor (ECF subfamily)
MTDEEHRVLLGRIARRDPDSELAMTALYRALNGNVFAFVRRRLGHADDHDVQAVVVDVMYEVWRAAAAFTGGSQVKTWVLGIARHKLLDAVRRNPQGVHHVDIADYAESLADDGADVFAALAARQQVEWLVFCMGKLPADQRESLHLLLVEGMSVEAIAQVQGCPNGTVKTRVFHAKAKLKSCMARWLDGEGATPSPAKDVNKVGLV